MEKEAKEKEKEKDKNRYSLFKKYFVDWFNGDEEKIKLKDVDMKKYFLRYLHEINYPRCHALQDPNIKPQIPHLICKTKDNKIDCGVFVMRYMETYMGETKYKTGFPKEGTQDALLDWVRTKYAYALINSEINLMKDDIMELAHEYNKQNKEKRESDQRKACAEIHKRLKDCH
ncbi:unnamed protein product [Lactuca virosa]|uniref:Ubiquitin-like protease family profile domain-containing protein n=1 Tax=Lactuca virosa TaxID=75947 RepID=A0AAU9LPN0_9ASTR|nr:unnamed protein product [Lactuca virosa]